MKSTTVFFLLTIITIGLFAQAPAVFNYQAVLRNDTGQPIASEEVTIGVAIFKASAGGTEVFTETHNTQTNEFGLINLQIGSVNSLQDIEWGSSDYFIEISVNGEVMGASQLLSVPFALHSQSSADAFSGNYNDLSNAPNLADFLIIEDPQNGDLIYYANQQWQKLEIGEEGQVLSVRDGIPQWVFPEQTVDSIIDFDGNIYHTVIIGNQQWMTSNLRTTSFTDGTPIVGGLDNESWSTTTSPAYAVFPHENVDGINSQEEMVNIYGKLYNYYAVMDPNGLCPAGWRVATRADYDELEMYVAYWGKQEGQKDNSVAGNYLKSCRQIGSPLGGECNTSEHPRWESNNNHHGTNTFGFNGLPAGRRSADGNFNNLGTRAYWWTSTELSYAMSYWRALWHDGGFAYSGFEYRADGLSVRCIKE